MKQTTYVVTRVYSYQHGATQIAGSSKRTQSNREHYDAAHIVVEAGFESSVEGSNSTIVAPLKQVSQVTMNGNVYIVEAVAA